MSSVIRQVPDWYDRWHAELLQSGPRMSDARLEATARLVAVLLCGEQSAIRIFAAEVERSRDRGATAAIRDLCAIEYDEHLHERALQAFCRFLPVPDDGHRLKRRAQRFFAGLGRIEQMSRHFGQISQLDSAVCKIMWHVEQSDVKGTSPLRHLATRIKRDEARHVAVSRHYAKGLGLDGKSRCEDGEQIREKLVEMLQPLATSFEIIGVDSDRLFAHIRRSTGT